MLELSEVTFSYDTLPPLLNGVCFSVARKERVALIGESGIGKTTLFRLIGGLESPWQGSLTFDKGPLVGQVSLMMQEDLLLPWRTVEQNLQLIYELEGKTKEIAPLLHRLGLRGKENIYPKALSFGMRQRVSLARALLLQRPLLLLDEPFSALDPKRKKELFELVKQEQGDRALLFITHDIMDACALAHRILLLKNGSIQKEWIVDGSLDVVPSIYEEILK